MTLEGIHWLLILLAVSFVSGGIFGPKFVRWLSKMPQYFLRPNYLKLVGYLKTVDGKSKISKKP